MRNIIRIFFLIVFAGSFAFGQSTEFSFQGKLYGAGGTVSSSRDMIFRLWDETAGVQIGSDVLKQDVQLSNGIFAVQLDFGSAAFTGADRWIEISVSLPGESNYTTLSPRQKLNSAPYSIKSLNSDTAQAANTAITATNSQQLGGVAANQYVLTSDGRMSNARNPLPNSPSYIQNQFGGAQSSNFFISGTGRANSLIATNIGVNTATPTAPLEVAGNVLTSGSQAGFLFADRGPTPSHWLLYASGFSARLLLGGVDKLVIGPTGILSTTNLASGTSNHACWNTATGEFSFCSSSRRYKTDIVDYTHGLDLLTKLRPVTFKWRSNNKEDIGFIAEEVSDIEPLLAFKNKSDEIEGVNYGQISTILVNAVKQQQEQIDAQAKQIDQLMKLVCVANPSAEACSKPEDEK